VVAGPQMVPELHGDRFFFFENFKTVEELRTKILGVDNVELYHLAKSQFKICYNLGYKKLINLKKIKF
jgi:hypothetical protein